MHATTMVFGRSVLFALVCAFAVANALIPLHDLSLEDTQALLKAWNLRTVFGDVCASLLSSSALHCFFYCVSSLCVCARARVYILSLST